MADRRTSPNLRRRVSVIAATRPETRTPLPHEWLTPAYLYGTRVAEEGEWDIQPDWVAPNAGLSTGVLPATRMRLAGPVPGDGADTGDVLFMYGPGGAFVQWTIVSIAISISRNFFQLTLADGVASGPAFQVVGITLGFSGIQRVTFGPDVTRNMWADISERDSLVVELDIGSTAQDRVDQQADILIRYQSDFALVRTVTDDLGRVWEIASAQALDGRRYLTCAGEREVLTSA